MHTVIGNLTCNPHLPYEVLRALTDDRWWWAENLNTPASILADLSGASDYCIRSCVARNPRTPAHILEKLSKDRSSDVRCWVAKNPSTPGPVRKLLAEDQNPQVRAVASLIICRQAG